MGTAKKPKNPIRRAATLLVIPMVAQLLSGTILTMPALADEPVFKAPSLMGEADANAVKTGDTTVGAEGSTEGKNYTVEDVTVEGNRIIPTDHILEVIKTKRGDKFDKAQVVQDLKAVNSMGYFDDRSLQAVPELSGSGVLLKIRVQENAPVTEFAFQGNTVLSNEDLAKLFSDQLGKPQNLTQLSQAIDKVEQKYHEQGYTLARVTDVKDDPDGSVHLQIDEGVINSVQIVGNKKTKDFIIRNAIKAKAGSVYNERLLTADLRKLYGNGYFQDIRRSLSPSTSDPDKYDLKVEVDEKRSGSVGMGGGIDALAGPFGSASFSDGNFMGRGQGISFNAQMGSGLFGTFTNAVNNGGQNFIPTQKTYQIRANYVIPDIGHGVTMAVSPFATDMGSMIIDNSMQQSLGLNVNFSKKISKHLSLNLGLLGENVAMSSTQALTGSSSIVERAQQLGLANQSNALGYAQGVRNTALKGGAYIGVNPSLAYDTRDQMFDPHTGMLAKANLGPNLGLTGASFIKLGASVSKYVPVTKDSTLAFNLQGGTALGSMPQFAAFRLGGFNGIRGYQMFSQLGSGSSMMMMTAEYRMPMLLPKGDPGTTEGKVLNTVHKNLRFVVFADGGGVGGNNIYNSLYSRINVGAAVGVGVRVKVPMIGMVRIDYGLPLLAPISGGRLLPRLTFGFGDKF